MLPILTDDPYLAPYAAQVTARKARFDTALHHLAPNGQLRDFAQGHRYFGFQADDTADGWWYREWSPEAQHLALIGDFNHWDRHATPLYRRADGVWEVFIHNRSFDTPLAHGSRVKVSVTGADGNTRDRIPAYILYAVQDDATKDFHGVVYDPRHDTPPRPLERTHVAAPPAPLIYECHTGMAQETEGVGTYREFVETILPRVKALGYNTIQLMAVQEHPYYGSFGYHVSSFFAPSSRFGTPQDLKNLIDAAHAAGIAVVMDIVHSHAVKNIAEGLNDFDGSQNQYFHKGERGYNEQWDSKCFDYARPEVQHFLLSNCAYWLTEFRFDGFRFDGITSMLYHHHGITDFLSYEQYFDSGVDEDALLYLQLANHLLHELSPDVLTVAEDMSGMPGMCRRIDDGGIGFDYRLGMGVPDYWIKTIKHRTDEEWEMGGIWHELTNRRRAEKTITYVESHDQALVGDKTTAMWLLDATIYTHMSKALPSIEADRGTAIHKILRLCTATLGGEGYLTFMGNEFGHPEWIDFPREGNDWSYRYARRQWSLADNPDLRYHDLATFDAAMIALLSQYRILAAPPATQIYLHDEQKIIVFERGGLLFAFNFHPTASHPDLALTVTKAGTYHIILNTDATAFGGFARTDDTLSYPTTTAEDGSTRLMIYLPSRCGLVLRSEK